MIDKKIKKVIVYTNGDSSLLSTWSNVPYFFTKTLIDFGIKVIQIDLSPTPRWAQIFEKVYKFLSPFFRNSSYNYFRSLLHFINIHYRIRKAVKKHPDVDAHFFLTFSFSAAAITRKPSILIGDWTYLHYLTYFENRKPDYLERQSLKRERKMIEASDLVISLFPISAKQIRSKFDVSGRAHYLGNVVNALHHPVSKLAEVRGKAQKNILFIGSAKYKEGLLLLFDAFKLLYEKDKQVKLDIIGVTQDQLNEKHPNVTCYGYLDKGNAAECSLYYSLLNTAGVFVNTTQKWGAFSACIEAMFFYIPVIVSPYNEFTATFGTSISFGTYSKTTDINLLSSQISAILESPFYQQLALNAHQAVKEFSWEKFVQNILTKLQKTDDIVS